MNTTRIDQACYDRGCACYDDRDKGESVEVVALDEERKRCAAIVRRAIVRNKDNIMHVQILKRVLEKIVNPRKK